MADNGVSHFLENGPRIFWKEQTIGLFPWPQPSTYTQSCSAMLAPLRGGLSSPHSIWVSCAEALGGRWEWARPLYLFVFVF